MGRDWTAFWAQTPRVSMQMIEAGRKGVHERSIATAWYSEYFARQKRLKGLTHYLEDKKPKAALRPGDSMDAAPWLALMGS